MKLLQDTKLTNKTIIKSISYSNDEILYNIMKLYNIDRIDLDPTFSKGNFYKKIREPRIKMDLFPQREDVIPCDSQSLALKPDTINSIVFDPPFVVTTGNVGIILTRFGRYKSIPLLWEFYKKSLEEFYRVLREDGIVIFKCQDTIVSSKQYISHVYVMNQAVKLGFYPIDLFILLAKNVVIGPYHHKQQHARKFHSYFWVFKKTLNRANYDI